MRQPLSEGYSSIARMWVELKTNDDVRPARVHHWKTEIRSKHRQSTVTRAHAVSGNIFPKQIACGRAAPCQNYHPYSTVEDNPSMNEWMMVVYKGWMITVAWLTPFGHYHRPLCWADECNNRMVGERGWNCNSAKWCSRHPPFFKIKFRIRRGDLSVVIRIWRNWFSNWSRERLPSVIFKILFIHLVSNKNLYDPRFLGSVSSHFVRNCRFVCIWKQSETTKLGKKEDKHSFNLMPLHCITF